jgi:hypothetical protein
MVSFKKFWDNFYSMAIFYDHEAPDDVRLSYMLGSIDSLATILIGDGTKTFPNNGKTRPVRLIHYTRIEVRIKKFFLEYFPEFLIEGVPHQATLFAHHDGESAWLLYRDVVPFLMALEDRAGREIIV